MNILDQQVSVLGCEIDWITASNSNIVQRGPGAMGALALLRGTWTGRELSFKPRCLRFPDLQFSGSPFLWSGKQWKSSPD